MRIKRHCDPIGRGDLLRLRRRLLLAMTMEGILRFIQNDEESSKWKVKC